MRPDVEIALIVSIPATLAAILSFTATMLGIINKGKIDVIETKVDGNTEALNARLEETRAALLKSTASGGKSLGILQEKDYQETKIENSKK